MYVTETFPENRERDALGHASGIPESTSYKEVDDVLHRCSFYTRRRLRHRLPSANVNFIDVFSFMVQTPVTLKAFP